MNDPMNDVRSAGKGLLLAMMEPPANIEEEFQDWYDSEHFPERAACEGFETAHRFVCIDGFPRYLAVYDLGNVDVLKPLEDCDRTAGIEGSAAKQMIATLLDETARDRIALGIVG